MAILKLDKDDVDVDIMAVELRDTFLKHFMAVKNKHGIHRRIRLPAHNCSVFVLAEKSLASVDGLYLT